jgi:PAS domain S-box-containing protein
MKGMISPINAGSQGPRFYRLMALVAIGFNLVFIIFKFVLLPDVVELFWDRLIISLYAGLIIYLSYSRIRRKHLYQLSSVLFYLFITQLVIAAYLNDFHPAYLICLGLSLQTISISFKNSSQAFLFLGYSTIASIAALQLDPKIDSNSAFYLTMGFLCLSIMLALLAHLKTRFNRENWMREELLRTIVSKTEDGILLTDFEGFIQEANQRVVQLFDYEISDLIGMNFSDLRNRPLTEEEDDNGVRQLLRNRFWNSEVKLKSKDGNIFFAFVSISWIQKFGSEYLLYKITDISERKEWEKQLISAKEMAEEATLAKSEFLATMSHEIRTPMNGVLGMTNILMAGELGKEQRSYLQTIKKSGENLLVIINDILDFSKIESGKMKLEKKAFAPKALIKDTIGLLKTTAEEKGLDLRLGITKDIPDRLIGDSTRIRQVLVNLIGNAIKFTQNGYVELQVRINDKGRMLCFTVRDTGIGIPQDKLGKLFDSFTQVDSSTTRKFGGTGLGLAISKKLVQLMGGKIWLESELNEGSQFHFTIPLQRCSESENKVIIPAIEQGTPHELLGLKVLLAEDNPINQQVGILILSNMGIEADAVSNGLEVQQALQTKDYDLVLMDVHMPEMDGLEATRWIRSQESFSELIVIALTANAFEEDKRKCLEAGMDEFITKPMQPQELQNVIIRLTSASFGSRA